jgi:alpha/beta hydrolase fold
VRTGPPLASFETPDGTRIFYTDAGRGRPVLLLHGWCCDGSDWSWQVPELEKRHRVITFDHRGHGRSSAPSGSYRAQVLADDAAALLAAVALGQAATRGMFDLEPEEVLEHPHVLIGTVDEICERLIERRERFGFSYVTIREADLEVFAPVVARLAGA